MFSLHVYYYIFAKDGIFYWRRKETQIYQIRICILIRSPGSLRAHGLQGCIGLGGQNAPCIISLSPFEFKIMLCLDFFDYIVQCRKICCEKYFHIYLGANDNDNYYHYYYHLLRTNYVPGPLLNPL